MEAFGVAAGALSVAALFNNCVECFGYIQLGRSFGRDYQTCQLRLDAARLRLLRWGEAANVHHSERFAAVSTGDDREATMAIAYFEVIHDLIQGVQKSAKRYQIIHPLRDTSLASSDDMTALGNKVHNRAAVIAKQRQRSARTLQKITWALYDGKELDRLISQIMELMDELEKIFPVESACRRLVEMEIEEVDDAPSLAVWHKAAKDTDPMLSEVVVSKLRSMIAGSNTSGPISTNGQADVQVGHRYSDQVMSRGSNVTDHTRNIAGSINAQGSSRVQIGNRFGGGT